MKWKSNCVDSAFRSATDPRERTATEVFESVFTTIDLLLQLNFRVERNKYGTCRKSRRVSASFHRPEPRPQPTLDLKIVGYFTLLVAPCISRDEQHWDSVQLKIPENICDCMCRRCQLPLIVGSVSTERENTQNPLDGTY